MVDPENRRARVQPGVVLDDLNETLKAHGFKFALDSAAGDRSTIGGAIGNNLTGAHSFVYGKSDEYVESCEPALAHGSVGPLPVLRAEPNSVTVTWNLSPAIVH